MDVLDVRITAQIRTHQAPRFARSTLPTRGFASFHRICLVYLPGVIAMHLVHHVVLQRAQALRCTLMVRRPRQQRKHLHSTHLACCIVIYRFIYRYIIAAQEACVPDAWLLAV